MKDIPDFLPLVTQTIEGSREAAKQLAFRSGLYHDFELTDKDLIVLHSFIQQQLLKKIVIGEYRSMNSGDRHLFNFALTNMFDGGVVVYRDEAGNSHFVDLDKFDGFNSLGAKLACYFLDLLKKLFK